MLSHVARLSSRLVAGRGQYWRGSEGGWSSGARGMATEAGPDGTVVKKRSGFGKKLLGAVALLAAGIYVGDLAMNDDLDTLSDRFRSRLPEEERKDRYVFCIGMFFKGHFGG